MIGLVVGGVASGVGKTTLTLGLIGALKRRGLTVQPFKVGPDYIDPSQHSQVAGRLSRNLDSWQVPEGGVRELFARVAATADVALVEGVMGLFDGRTGGGETGSTAHVAKLLGLPVLLVIDAAKAARSVAATVLGCKALDPDLNIVGVVLNNVAGARHAEIGREAIESLAQVPVLGWLPRHADLRQEERYLGLVPAAERQLPAGMVERLSALIEEHLDLDRLIALARPELAIARSAVLFPAVPVPTRARIAVAQDEAFSFYYQDSLDLLRAWGAELVPFSPLRDQSLPPNVGGVYLGGGFPELFAIDLAVNAPMLASLRDAADADLPIYAECGGLMYLQESLVDADGRRHRMAGIVAGQSTLVGKRLTLGYREVRARRASPIATAGQQLRGHEFHWSVCDPPGDMLAAYDVLGGAPRAEGYAAGNVLASYVHLHFASDPGLAPRFVDACAAPQLTVNGTRRGAKAREGQRTESPPTLVLGVGCSVGASADEIEALARAALASAELPWERIRVVATIDQRVVEPGVVEIARRAGAVLVGFPAAALAKVVDAPTPSAEVWQHVGTPGVCEPAALLASDGGALVVAKQRSAHATVAVARLPQPASAPGDPGQAATRR